MERKRWLIFLTFQRIRKHFTKLCNHELKSDVIAGGHSRFGEIGVQEESESQIVYQSFPVTRNSWCNSFPTDLEFITWKHREIRQNTNSLPQLTTVELSNKSHGTTVRGVVCSSKILVTRLLPLSFLLLPLLMHSLASALLTHSFCLVKDSTALSLLITAFSSFLSLNSPSTLSSPALTQLFLLRTDSIYFKLRRP